MQASIFTASFALDLFIPIGLSILVVVAGNLLTKKFKKQQKFEVEIKLMK